MCAQLAPLLPCRLSISQSPGPSQLPRMAAPQASHTTVPGPMHPALARKRSARLSGQHRHSTDSDFSKENEPEEPLPGSRSVEGKLEAPKAKLEAPEARLEAPTPKVAKPAAKPVADTPAVTTESAQVQEQPAPAPAVEALQPAKTVSEAVKAVNKENVQPASQEPAKVRQVGDQPLLYMHVLTATACSACHNCQHGRRPAGQPGAG